MAWKSIVTELLWFLRGDTNIKYLVDNNCHIWDGDAYKNYDKLCIDTKWMEPVKKELNGEVYDMGRKYDQEGFINRIKTDNEFANKWGDLGPIYGKQWRNWGGKQVSVKDGKVVTTINDQITNLINDLKTNPDSRRLMVNAWNVGEIDQMTLPPCHYGFQVYTRELSLEERHDIKEQYGFDCRKLAKPSIEQLDAANIPTRAISLMWNQRSVDTFLGLPFNIASYGLLLEILAKEVNMVPDELIGNLGDTHLYSNHIEQAKEQIGRELTWEEKIQWVMRNTDVELENLYITEAAAALERKTREPYQLPTLRIESEVKCAEGDCLPKYSVDDFFIENYQSHPAIKAPLSN
jgi:thymidylate synthase